MESKRNDTNELTKKKETENKIMVVRGKTWGEGIVRKFGMDMYAQLYLKWITNKDLLDNIGNSAQVMW